MTTTIAVKESTAQLLISMKKKMGLSSIDETILKIVHKIENVPASRFGSQPKLRKFEHSERGQFHEL